MLNLTHHDLFPARQNTDIRWVVCVHCMIKCGRNAPENQTTLKSIFVLHIFNAAVPIYLICENRQLLYCTKPVSKITKSGYTQ